MSSKIYIATHTDYCFPQKSGYIPIFAGRALHGDALTIHGDDVGENISMLNNQFCELTVLYWIWKNCRTDIVGLVHYRRYFADLNHPEMNIIHKDKPILDVSRLSELMSSENRVFLPKPQGFGKRRILKLFKKQRTVYQQYKDCHFKKDWLELEKTVNRLFPAYAETLGKVKNDTQMSCCNMFIAYKSFVDAYCTWLFEILFDLYNRLDTSGYDNYQRRIFGFMAERLLNVYVRHHAADLDIQYLDITFLE